MTLPMVRKRLLEEKNQQDWPQGPIWLASNAIIVRLKGQEGWTQRPIWLDPNAYMVDLKGQYGWPQNAPICWIQKPI